ncbi:MAG: hypothetical protein IJ410_08920 [Oscillospiraceae bacterium]|nr:hypothetical protein [Oscillospiraceae bacterium]
MKEYILKEKQLHPAALPQDYIKLIFQSEFGPGHLIADRNFSHDRLINEWESVKNLPQEESQEIGGGYIRLCIKGIDRSVLDKVNTAFVTSANEKTGSEASFMSKISLFVEMAAEDVFDFTQSEAVQAVEEYLKGGIKPTSHTKTYHSHYTPAYRVVRKELWNKL